MDLRQQIDLQRLPQHIAIIMDGNGRWAQQHDKPRVFGHQSGVEPVRDLTEASAELGVRYLTLYAFSTENWKRPQTEVEALMTLLAQTIKEEVVTLNDNDIRLNIIGELSRLPDICRELLLQAIDDTKHNARMTLTLALNYSGRWELTHAMKRMAEAVSANQLRPEDITQDTVGAYLATAGMPDPELLIRTSGEQRISNFLLWQLAYSELCFIPKYWPDIRKNDLYNAILDYQHRERRFGLTSEQITNK